MKQELHLPAGFRFGGTACGIKPSGKSDLGMIVSDKECVAAGVYTQNVVRAASIDWNRQITPTQNLRAIVVNSGNANACTGQQGANDNFLMAAKTATHLGVAPEQVAVLSTGVIGQVLPIDQVATGIGQLIENIGQDSDHFSDAANAILTTDVGPKTASSTFEHDGQKTSIAGMAKGAGMIGPRMATMLSVVVTDMPLTPTIAQELIHAAAELSFNRISVEGHMSTNDALILLTSGRNVVPNDEHLTVFAKHLNNLCLTLAKLIPADGEGATHLVEIAVDGAKSDIDADKIARCVASSNLVKTAIAGADPNWGRIVSAVGYATADIAPCELGLRLNGFTLFESGQPANFDAQLVSRSIRDSHLTQIELKVGGGLGVAKHWTSDLTVDYVRFNSEYTT